MHLVPTRSFCPCLLPVVADHIPQLAAAPSQIEPQAPTGFVKRMGGVDDPYGWYTEKAYFSIDDHMYRFVQLRHLARQDSKCIENRRIFY
jgi:hypothetical protein